jgi:excisionase family DNA binding protein
MKATRKQISAAEQSRRARQRAMSIGEFCQRYGVGRTTVYEEIKSGRLRGRKIGKRTVITDDDAEYWLEHLPTIPPASETEAA